MEILILFITILLIIELFEVKFDLTDEGDMLMWYTQNKERKYFKLFTL